MDPLAEGLMILGVNGGTKALSHILLASKSYRAQMRFGIYSSTGDEEGEKTELPTASFTLEDFEKIIPQFLGKISQMPPVYSALKINGKRACDRVRDGEEVTLTVRTIEIFKLEISHFDFPTAEIFVECSSGTYIRSLVQDLGESMGSTAYMTALTRESLGNFLLKDACELDAISWEKVQPFLPEHFALPTILVSPEQQKDLFMGRTVLVNYNTPSQEIPQSCAIFCNGEWMGFGEIQEGILSPKKMLGGDL